MHFDEGAIVEKGDLLFTIDDRQYRADVASRRAEVARAKTRVELAEQDLARAEQLAAARAVSAEELDDRRGELKQANADLSAVEAISPRLASRITGTFRQSRHCWMRRS